MYTKKGLKFTQSDSLFQFIQFKSFFFVYLFTFLLTLNTILKETRAWNIYKTHIKEARRTIMFCLACLDYKFSKYSRSFTLNHFLKLQKEKEFVCKRELYSRGCAEILGTFFSCLFAFIVAHKCMRKIPKMLENIFVKKKKLCLHVQRDDFILVFEWKWFWMNHDGSRKYEHKHNKSSKTLKTVSHTNTQKKNSNLLAQLKRNAYAYFSWIS